MFEELIKINKNGYTGKYNRSFPDIVKHLVESAYYIRNPLIIFSICSLLIGLTLSYLTLLLDFYQTLLGRWITYYVIFLLLTPSLIMLLFCYQLTRLIRLGEKFIATKKSRNTPKQILKGNFPQRVYTAFKNINRYMIHYKNSVKEFSKLKLLVQPLFYYLVIASAALNIAYFGILLVIGFGSSVWYFLHP